MAESVKRLPLRKDIEIDQGDSWQFPYILKLPDLANFGFTAHDLTGVTIKGQIKPSFRGEVLATMNAGVIDAAQRHFRPWLPHTATLDAELEGIYDIQITDNTSGWTRTFYRGEVKLNRQVTT